MTTDDKRKETSRLTALKSTGPKTPEGKRRSAFNSVTHAAYVQEFILDGEELSQDRKKGAPENCREGQTLPLRQVP